MKVLDLAYKLGHQKFSLGLGLVSFGSGDETSLGQHSMYLPSFYLTSPHVKTLPCIGLYLQSNMQSNTGDNEGMRLRSGGSWVNMFI